MHDELLADNPRRAYIITAVILACILSGCERPADAARTRDEANSEPATGTTQQSDLTRTFVTGSEEDIIKALQDGTDFSGEPNLEWFSILQDIWYEREDSHPDFAWSVLKSPRVKVVLGSQLAQAYRNRMIPLNVEDIRKFALANYAHSDNRVARPSVLLLGEVGNSSDIPLLVQLAHSDAGGRRLYKEAVTALVHICDEEAERAIKALLPEGTDDDRQFAEGWLSNRDHLLRAWCH